MQTPRSDTRHSVISLLRRKYSLSVLRVAGGGLLVSYLVVSRDWTFSIPWTFGFLACAAAVVAAVSLLKVEERFPGLNRYLFARKRTTTSTPLTHEEWQKQYAEWQQKYIEHDLSRVKLQHLVFTLTEDGLICVPVLLIGIGPVSAITGGVVFGVLHLMSRTYLDGIVKAAIYSLVCLFVLPHGLLTVVAGHFLNDVVAWIALRPMLKSATKESLKTREG